MTPPGQGGETRSYTFSRLDEAVLLSAEARRFARELGFPERAAGEIAVVASELVTNACKFAGGGSLHLRACAEAGRVGLEICCEDRGPGIPDPEQAKLDGFSEGRFIDEGNPARSRRGLGVGLGAVERLSDALRLEQPEGGGTRAVAIRWLPEPKPRYGLSR